MIFSTLARVAALFLFLGSAFNTVSAWQPIRAHPLNPYILEFRGRPTLLRTFGPAYEWLFDSTLSYTPYLDVFHRDGMNITRIWCLGYPAWVPEDFIQPWQRSTTGTHALDGLEKWDLNTWNEAYFTRLKAITQAASDRGIVVEFTFFSVLYEDIEWEKSPFHPSNNLQGFGSPTSRYECIRQNSINALLFEKQTAAVRRIVRELNGFDNVIFEIVNEPFWNEPGVKDAEEVAFHNSMLAAIREEEAVLPNRHLVAHNFPQQMSVMSADFDILNEHYPAAVPGSTIAGAEALLSNHYSRGRILSFDESNTVNELQTRLEPWMFFIGGGGIYDGLDYQAVAYTETNPSGDNALGNSIRRAVRNSWTYMNQLHLVKLRRNLAWVTGGQPAGSTLQASASPGQQYVAYLHHGQKSITYFQLNYNPIYTSNHSVSLKVSLPAGTWRAVWTQPSSLTELYAQTFTVTGGQKILNAVTYQADVALRIDRTGSGDSTPPPQTNDLAATSNTNGSITLSWSPVTAFDLASYHIYRSENPSIPLDPSHRIATSPAATTSVTDQPPVRGVTYYYTVTTVDQIGNESAPIPEVTALSIAPVLLSVTALHGSVTGAGLHDLNSTVTLTATPDTGYVFTVWSGDIEGIENPILVVMDGNKNITANFLSEAVDSDGDGVPDEADPDDDNDGTPDETDAFPLDPAEAVDTDQDGTGNNADPDDDGDGAPDETDAFPLDPAEAVDTDQDGTGNNADPDDDGDGTPDETDAFPLNPNETTDTDNDGIGNNADPDDDGDGAPDEADAFPLNPNETTDTDNDGIGNNADPDDDGDNVPDETDAFPLDPAEAVDTDQDGIGNNADLDDDGDGTHDETDAFPLNPNETTDTDHDGIGNNADLDDDGDGAPDETDAFPLNPNETTDTDSDGIGNNADPDDDGDGTPDETDAFPLNPAETTDTDHDGIGNNADLDDDGDGTPDETDAFPLNPAETTDTDQDSIGNNADPDDDNDGTPDETDAFPLDPAENTDTDHDGTGNNADPDDDGDGFDDQFEIATGFDPTDANSTPDALSSIRTAVEFRFNAANGVSYRIEASTDLIVWEVNETDIIGQSAVVTRFYSTENQPLRFFRARRN